MDRTRQLLVPTKHRVRNPLYLDNCALWLRPDSGVFTGGSRTLTAGDKASFVGTARNTTRIAGVDFWFSAWINVSTTTNQIIFSDYPSTDKRGILVYTDSSSKLSIEL